MKTHRLYIALPVLNEFSQLPALFQSLESQTFTDFELVVCVNQYDDWWQNPEKRWICEDNGKSLEWLRQRFPFAVWVMDCSSPGRGWKTKKGGVGYARKTALDTIASHASENDIIVSMDADTFYPPDYLQVIFDYFQTHPKYLGLSLPYYHRLTDNPQNDRLILRYEIYMRYYALNMIRIRNPYRFTALGSAMAFPVWAYRKVGGMTPVQSGEDFYFLQKLVKSGTIGYTAGTVAYPSARFSDRVNFGTGPALIKGKAGNWDSYPFYPSEWFDRVGETYWMFSELYDRDRRTPMDLFLKKTFKTADIWGPLRENYKDRNNFIKACISKVDGLRILQFLKGNYHDDGTVVSPLTSFLERYYPEVLSEDEKTRWETVGFDGMEVGFLDRIRRQLFRLETEARNG
jgi:glycosyltransferase involved in cell wall biosynthesis